MKTKRKIITKLIESENVNNYRLVEILAKKINERGLHNGGSL